MHIYLTNEWYMTVKTRAQWTPIRPTCSFYDPASRCYQSWGAAIACKSPEGQCFFWTNILPDWTDFCSHFSSNHSGLTPADPGSHSPLDSMERPTEPFAGYHGHGWGERLNKFKDQIAWKWISRRYIYKYIYIVPKTPRTFDSSNTMRGTANWRTPSGKSTVLLLGLIWRIIVDMIYSQLLALRRGLTWFS